VSGLVIFDCDGVLVDSELIFARVLAECLIAVDFPTTIDEAITLGFGKNRATLSAAVAARFGRALPDTFFETFAARSAAAFEHELSPMAGVEDLLAALPTLRCVASNGRLDASANGLR
jgi:beta-phosphoglucomutase-like phosphatase (HAD superfamily)